MAWQKQGRICRVMQQRPGINAAADLGPLVCSVWLGMCVAPCIVSSVSVQ